MKDARPVNLDLTKFRFPITAIISILHRISGVVIFLFLPLMLYFLHNSLVSQASFSATAATLGNLWVKFLMWIMLSAVFYHLLAGIRHITMDLGFFEGLCAGKATSYVVLILAIILSILAGVWLW